MAAGSASRGARDALEVDVGRRRLSLSSMGGSAISVATAALSIKVPQPSSYGSVASSVPVTIKPLAVSFCIFVCVCDIKGVTPEV